MKLYHYTCEDHGRPGIERDGYLRPNIHPLLGEALVWATDLDEPFREALGLTSHSLSCDRTACRYEVQPWSFVPWHRYARRLYVEQREALEIPGTMPRHWWVSSVFVRVMSAEVSA
jgi:hypothetical protein